MKIIDNKECSRLEILYQYKGIDKTILFPYKLTPEYALRFETTREMVDDVIDIMNSGDSK